MVTAKTEHTSCTNWAISFGVSGFRTRTHPLHGHFIFYTYCNSRLFCIPMHHSKRRYNFSTLSNIISYFQSFTNLFRELNDREIENHYKMNSEKCWNLAWYHHFALIACANEQRGSRRKLDAPHVQTGQSLSEYQGFGRELICYTDTSMFFKLI